MSNLTHLFTIGQKVKSITSDFDGTIAASGVVAETYPDHLIVDFGDYKGYYEEGFNLDKLYTI